MLNIAVQPHRFLASAGFYLLEANCSRRSASQTLMMDWRVTPNRLASLSRDSIIHSGKSTFTLLCFCKGRRALAMSKTALTSLPLSKSESNFFAFIQNHLFRPRPANRDDANVFAAVCDDRSSVLIFDSANDHESGFISRFCRNLNQIRIAPKILGLKKINTMFFQVNLAFLLIEPKR